MSSVDEKAASDLMTNIQYKMLKIIREDDHSSCDEYPDKLTKTDNFIPKREDTKYQVFRKVVKSGKISITDLIGFFRIYLDNNYTDEKIMIDLVTRFEANSTPKQKQGVEYLANKFESTSIPKQGAEDSSTDQSFPITKRELDEMTSTLKKIERKCANCHMKGSTKQCACKQVHYCSKECQVENWPTHKLTCNYIESKS